jgi:hypothetical protein
MNRFQVGPAICFTLAAYLIGDWTLFQVYGRWILPLGDLRCDSPWPLLTGVAFFVYGVIGQDRNRR